VPGPPHAFEGSDTATPGRLETPEQWVVENEVHRLEELFPRNTAVQPLVRMINGSEGTTVQPGSTLALLELLRGLGLAIDRLRPLQPAVDPAEVRERLELDERQRRQVKALEDHLQRLIDTSRQQREESFWRILESDDPGAGRAALQRRIRKVLLGQPDLGLRAEQVRSRFLREGKGWVAYELQFDSGGVFPWQALILLPTNLSPGERRPVVVCEHGLGDEPSDLLDETAGSVGDRVYHACAARLAERGFVVVVPRNFFAGANPAFRAVQRKLTPLGLHLVSFALVQHAELRAWLGRQPFVDPERIGLYGFSYGGKLALYVPALLEGYAAADCSANFNDWIRKLVSVQAGFSYVYTAEHEMPEWNMAGTFSHAELAGLIAPRPFLVERGHEDPVSRDDWVTAEFERVKQRYATLGIAESAEFSFFDGKHEANVEAAIRFFERHFNWPPRTPADETGH